MSRKSNILLKKLAGFDCKYCKKPFLTTKKLLSHESRHSPFDSFMGWSINGSSMFSASSSNMIATLRSTYSPSNINIVYSSQGT